MANPTSLRAQFTIVLFAGLMAASAAAAPPVVKGPTTFRFAPGTTRYHRTVSTDIDKLTAHQTIEGDAKRFHSVMTLSRGANSLLHHEVWSAPEGLAGVSHLQQCLRRRSAKIPT